MDFLLVLTELFSLCDTAKSLRAKRDRKLVISLQRGQVRGRPQSPNIFEHIVRPMNALQLYRWQFSHKETL